MEARRVITIQLPIVDSAHTSFTPLCRAWGQAALPNETQPTPCLQTVAEGPVEVLV